MGVPVHTSPIFDSPQTHHTFPPSELKSRVPAHTLCTTSVRVWGTSPEGHALNDPTAWSESSRFTSLPEGFTAKTGPDSWGWITEAAAVDADGATNAATSLFRTAFSLAPEAPRSAVVSVAGLGQYELTINGKRVGCGHQGVGVWVCMWYVVCGMWYVVWGMGYGVWGMCMGYGVWGMGYVCASSELHGVSTLGKSYAPRCHDPAPRPC